LPPDKRLFYGQVDDQRQCEACSCDPPTGATCSVKVHVFSDSACTTERLAVDISPEMGGDCFPLMSGVALAGIAAEVLDYQPGTCEPHGSEPVSRRLFFGFEPRPEQVSSNLGVDPDLESVAYRMFEEPAEGDA
jgi:hypothetical protein